MLPDAVPWEADRLLSDRWRRHAATRPDDEAVVHWIAGEEPFRWRWGDLLAEAERLSNLLAAERVGPGDVCALMLRHHRMFYPLYLAVSLRGAVPTVLAYPNPRLHPDKFRQGLVGMARHSGLDWLLTERELEPVVNPLIAEAEGTVRGLLFPLEWDSRPPTPASPPTAATSSNDGESCLLQHSSGTTGLQKGVLLSHRAVLGHLRRYGAAIGLEPGDKVASWLPLYHDMGLIAAFHLPLAYGVPAIQIDPFEWVRAPYLLLEAMSRERATVAWMPNFAYNLMADGISPEDLHGIRLDHVRLLVNCSEPVRAASHDRFLARFAPHGLSPQSLAACYAMAETTFAVTQTRPGVPPRHLDAVRDELAQGRFRPARPGEAVRSCTSSGDQIDGCRVRVVNPDGADLPAGQVGELLIRSESLFDGYRNQPLLTARAVSDGWYRSGDLGFVHEEEVYVIGRVKDLIIVAGKNVYPEDVEAVLNDVPGVVPGRVVAFGLEEPVSGTEEIAVLVETDLVGPERQHLPQAIFRAGTAVGLTLRHVHLVPPRWLVKSSAGKLSRQTNKERFLQEEAARSRRTA